MGTLLITYTAAALALSLYAAWLVMVAAKITRRLKQLECSETRQTVGNGPERQIHKVA
jgi:hypothetical protein